MKKIVAFLLIAVMVFSLASCGDSSGDSGKLPTVGVTIYKYDDNFMSFVRQKIEHYATDKIEVSMNDSQNDQAKQNEQIDALIQKGVKALGINLVDPQAANTVIDKAKAKELPVIFFNKEPDANVLASYDKAYYVGTNSAESGVMQGKIVVDEWNKNKDKWDKNGDGKIQYVLLKGEPGHPDAEARTTFVVKTVTDEGIEVEELENQTGMWDTSKAKDLMDAWISKYGDDIEFVFANNDAMALGAIESLSAAGYFEDDKFIPVVGVDAIPDALTKIEEGKMLGTVLNDANNQGKAIAELLINVANGKDVLKDTEWKFTENQVIRVPYVGVTINNIEVGKKAYE